MSDEKKMDDILAAFRSRPPMPSPSQRIRHKVQLGFSVVAGAERPTLSMIIPGDSRPMIARKIMVAPAGYAVVEMRHNGDPVGFEDDFLTWRAREYVDDDDARWRNPEFRPAVVDGSYAVDEYNVLPLIHLEDRIEIVLAWRGVGPPPDKYVAVLFGTIYGEESDVVPYEVSFDSGTSIEPGESREMHVDLDRTFRADRFYVVGGPRLHRCFVIEQIRIGARNQLAGGVVASALVSAPRAYIETASVGMRASVTVCCVDPDSMPRHFRGKLIGLAFKPGADRGPGAA